MDQPGPASHSLDCSVDFCCHDCHCQCKRASEIRDQYFRSLGLLDGFEEANLFMQFAIYMATIDYMVASYGPYAASATGGNALARDFLAGVAAMYSVPCKPLLYTDGGRKVC